MKETLKSSSKKSAQIDCFKFIDNINLFFDPGVSYILVIKKDQSKNKFSGINLGRFLVPSYVFVDK